MARGGLFQRAVVTAETDKFRVAQYRVLLLGFLLILYYYSPGDSTSLGVGKRSTECSVVSFLGFLDRCGDRLADKKPSKS